MQHSGCIWCLVTTATHGCFILNMSSNYLQGFPGVRLWPSQFLKAMYIVSHNSVCTLSLLEAILHSAAYFECRANFSESVFCPDGSSGVQWVLSIVFPLLCLTVTYCPCWRHNRMLVDVCKRRSNTRWAYRQSFFVCLFNTLLHIHLAPHIHASKLLGTTLFHKDLSAGGALWKPFLGG